MKTAVIVYLVLCISLCQVSFAFYDGDSKVVKLTADNFRSKVINSNELWLVEFYAPWCGHCQKMVPDFEKVAKALDGIIKIGAVDMTTDQAAGASYDVKGFPTLKFFGADKNKPDDYNGDRSINDMINFAFTKAKQVAELRLKGKGGSTGGSSHSGGQQQQREPVTDKDVIVLSDNDFEDLVMGSEDLWLVEFYAPWCGHCQRLEPEWNDAAARLKGEVKVAKVDATTSPKVAQQFGVSGYPTIKMFPPGKKSMGNVEDYGGSRDGTSITSWALEKKAQFKPVLKVDQLVDTNLFDEYCVKQKGLCLITFLPHIYDTTAEERNAEVEALQEIQKSNRLNPVTIVWSQGGDQYEFEEALGLGSGYPAVVAIHVGKMKYAIMKGAFNKKNVDTWINTVITGREALFDLKALPPVKPIQRWDGQDHKPAYEDEDL
jgi:protein disulfide-isomerase A6